MIVARREEEIVTIVLQQSAAGGNETIHSLSLFPSSNFQKLPSIFILIFIFMNKKNETVSPFFKYFRFRRLYDFKNFVNILIFNIIKFYRLKTFTIIIIMGSFF